MNRKRVRSFALAVVILAASVFPGCGSGESQYEEEVTSVPDEMILASFEEWYPDFSSISIYNDFGKVSVNTTGIYVSEGSRSARLDPLGGEYGSSAPIVVFGTKSDKTGKDCSDFSYADSVSFDMYNPQDDTTIYAGLISNIVNATSIRRTNEQEITLTHGWNSCSLGVEPSLVDMVGNLANVQGLYLRFEPAYAANIVEDGEGQTPRYYIDNIKIVNNPQKSQVGFKIDQKNGEIADFERLYQQYMFTNDNAGDIKVVSASDYNLTAPSGKHVLRVTLGGMGEDSGEWRGLNISDVLLRGSDIYEMDAATAKNAYLCFDVYNGNETSHSLAFVFRTTDSKLTDAAIKNEPGKWTTFEYCLGDLLSYQANYLSTFGMFVISYKTNFDGDCEYFLDNFRVEYR